MIFPQREEYATKKQRDMIFEMLNSVETFEPKLAHEAHNRPATPMLAVGDPLTGQLDLRSTYIHANTRARLAL